MCPVAIPTRCGSSSYVSYSTCPSGATSWVLSPVGRADGGKRWSCGFQCLTETAVAEEDSLNKIFTFDGCVVLLFSGLFVSMDESVAQSHEQMGSCVRFIKQNNIPSELGVELKDFFSMDMNQKCSLSLADQNLVYRNLPLSIQVEVSCYY